MLVLGGSLGAGSAATAWVEGVGVMGVAGALKVVEAVVELVVKLDGTFGCQLKVSETWSVLSKSGYTC